MTRKPGKTGNPGKSASPAGSVSLAEAATLLGVGEEVLVAALEDHGLSAAEAAGARLLTSELEAFRERLQGSSERVQAQLAALRGELEGE